MSVFDEIFDRTEADELADVVSPGILPNITSWTLARAYVRQVLPDETEGFRDAMVEALGRRAGLDMRWTVPAGAGPDTTTDDNPNLGRF